MTVYTVLYDDGKSVGLGESIARFRTRAQAQEFAQGKSLYGQPAVVQIDRDVPRRLAQRWGVG